MPAETRNAYKILAGNLKTKYHLGDVSLDERMILKCILQKLGVRMWIRFIWFRKGSSEHGTEPMGARHGGKFVDQLNDHQILKDSLFL
jgi:hypothetical protein